MPEATSESKPKGLGYQLAVVPLLLCCAPVGIGLLWYWKLWTRTLRLALTFVSVVLFIGGLAATASGRARKTETGLKTEVAAKVEDAGASTGTTPDKAPAPDGPGKKESDEDKQTADQKAFQEIIDNPKTPQDRITKLVFETDSDASAEFKNGKLVVTKEHGNEGEWNQVLISGHVLLMGLARGGFGAIPELKSITVVEYASVNDARGNETPRTKIGEFTLSRAKAKGINWPRVKSENVPDIIDHSWMKRGLSLVAE